MKPADFTVRIPEPCHEDWNKMQPDAKGKFCSSCSKSVFDFSNKTDAEIKHILIEHKDEKVCGHFKKTQIDRPLDMKLDLHHLPNNISITKTFALALFLVFGSLLFSCKDEKGKEIPLKGMPEMVAGLIMAPLPPFSDSSACMITGEVPYTDTLENVYQNDESTVDGGISFTEVYDVPPVPPAPVEHIAGGLSYYVFEPDPVKDTLSSDSTFHGSKRISDTGDDPSVLSQVKDFSIYPNPSSGEFTIKYDLLKRTDVKITIFDMSGALVKHIVNVTGQYDGQYQVPVNLNELPNGIYIVNFIHNGERSTERLVIAR